MTSYSKKRYKGAKVLSRGLKSRSFHFKGSTLLNGNLLFGPKEDTVSILSCNIESPRRLKWFEKAKLEWERSEKKVIARVEPVKIQGYTTYL